MTCLQGIIGCRANINAFPIKSSIEIGISGSAKNIGIGIGYGMTDGRDCVIKEMMTGAETTIEIAIKMAEGMVTGITGETSIGITTGEATVKEMAGDNR